MRVSSPVRRTNPLRWGHRSAGTTLTRGKSGHDRYHACTTRANLDGATYDCNSCHTLNGADHTSTNESAARHTLHTGSIYGITCADCHANPGGTESV